MVGVGKVEGGVKHGSNYAYQRKGCRCETCKTAAVERNRRWRIRYPEKAAAKDRRDRERAARRRRAQQALADQHAGEYLKLLEEDQP